MYTEMLNMALAEESIRPEKFKVEGHPMLREFPSEHPNKATKQREKDEL